MRSLRLTLPVQSPVRTHKQTHTFSEMQRNTCNCGCITFCGQGMFGIVFFCCYGNGLSRSVGSPRQPTMQCCIVVVKLLCRTLLPWWLILYNMVVMVTNQMLLVLHLVLGLLQQSRFGLLCQAALSLQTLRLLLSAFTLLVQLKRPAGLLLQLCTQTQKLLIK